MDVAELQAAESSRASGDIPVEVRAINRQRFRDLVRAREQERAIELVMLARPWGFQLEDITTEVHLWYGSEDATTPLYMAKYLYRAIPHATLKVWPGEGHHAGFTHWAEVLQALIQ
jgi:pimeloyl-ACP methyl ester carboxylesterase